MVPNGDQFLQVVLANVSEAVTNAGGSVSSANGRAQRRNS